VHEALSDARPVNAEHAIRCVFGVLSRHVSEGQVRKIRDALPSGFRPLWEREEQPHATHRHPEPRRELEPLILTEAEQV